MKTITIFTPTYNRANLLPRLYESLCRQSSKDFLWLVIDDGSTDNTKELIQGWVMQSKIDIQYVYKENGGMHTGHNAAYRLIETELNVCIDSDDYILEDVVEKIIDIWFSIKNKNRIAGIIGLDATEDGIIIGQKIPDQLSKGSLADLYRKHNVKGDKKVVLRSDIAKKYPGYPEYENEKLVPLGILYLMIGENYDFIYSNEIFCIVEYQQDGSSNTILKQYRKSPKGFAYARKIQIKFSNTIQDVFKAYIHLTSSAIFAKDISLLWRDVNPFVSVLALPFGILLNLWIRIKR